jgi:hypothetical protein
MQVGDDPVQFIIGQGSNALDNNWWIGGSRIERESFDDNRAAILSGDKLRQVLWLYAKPSEMSLENL